MGKHSHYGVILDAGSSGTRVYVYKWKNPARTSRMTSVEDLHRLPKLKLKESKKIHPGVSTFASRPGAVGKEHLRELIDVAFKAIPKDKVAETPIFLLATAGVRFLPNSEQKALLAGICSWLQKETVFDLADCKQNVQVISGETEGLYGWIAANYLLGGFNHPQAEGPGQGHHHTYGFLDMGGASAQIAFAPNATETKKHADDLKLVRMRHMDGTPAEYKVFTTTWLGFGANKARERFVEGLHEQYGDANELPDPCLPVGLRTTLEGDTVEDAEPSDEQTLVGTGQFDECLRLTYPLLEKNAPCDDHPCLFNGQHVPAIDFNVNHFVGVSEYWHTTHGVFGGKDKAYDLETYQRSVMDFCSRDWSDIEADVLDKRKKAEDARDACFKASWLINMLYDGIGIPRVGLEVPSGVNTTFEPVKGYEDSFQPVNKIDGVELSWTLGKMVLYASGQVPSRGEPLPVGFGSNVPSGEPDDFENAGSIPLFPVTGMDGSEDDDDDDDDDDDGFLHAAKSSHGAAFVIFVIVIFLAVLLLRRPERRRRLFSFARRRKSGAGQKPSKPSRGFSLASKLFGRGSHQYERVMEEGEASEFELHGVESDETEHSDSSDGSGAPRASGLLTPRFQAGRFADELRPASALDRQGLVVRTESRERLAGIGRRSRAGSPQRQKSALSPLGPD